MEIEILSEDENPMLHRTDVRFEVVHNEATPGRLSVRDSLAARLNKDAEEVVVHKLDTKYGMRRTVGYAKVYDSPDDAQDVEQEYMLARNKIGDAAIEDGAAEEPEEAEGDEEPAETEESPADESEPAPAEEEAEGDEEPADTEEGPADESEPTQADEEAEGDEDDQPEEAESSDDSEAAADEADDADEEEEA